MDALIIYNSSFVIKKYKRTEMQNQQKIESIKEEEPNKKNAQVINNNNVQKLDDKIQIANMIPNAQRKPQYISNPKIPSIPNPNQPLNIRKYQSQIMPKPFNSSKLSQIRKSQIQSQQIFHMQIASHQIITKDQDSTQLCQSLTCPICLMILQLPYYQCQSCSNGFCVACIQGWWKKEPNTCVFKCQHVDFKLVKRSNTYNAVVGMLKTVCQYCKEQYTIGDIANHMIKSCPEVPQFCRFCQVKLPRKLIQDHQKLQCDERPWNCPHCQTLYSYSQHDTHQPSCPQKPTPCPYPDCLATPKQAQLPLHLQYCNHRILQCEWCHKQMKLLTHTTHIQSCQSRTTSCPWCTNTYKITQYQQHEIKCQQRKDICQLCQTMVYVKDVKEHRVQCMYESLVEIKNRNQVIERENVRLKEKVMMLEGILEQTISNSKESTIKVVAQMRDQQKKAMEKDLLRLDNSIRSVQKLRRQQQNKHKKFPHLIQSWCPICKQLQRKFNAMLEPLVEQKKEVLMKISQIQRFAYTPK